MMVVCSQSRAAGGSQGGSQHEAGKLVLSTTEDVHPLETRVGSKDRQHFWSACSGQTPGETLYEMVLPILKIASEVGTVFAPLSPCCYPAKAERLFPLNSCMHTPQVPD